MKLITQTSIYHVSLEIVDEFEKSILADPIASSKNQANRLFSKVLFLIWKGWNKVKVLYNNKKILNSESHTLLYKEYFFSVLMGPDFSKCLPYFIFPAYKNIYLFDAWPKDHDNIIHFVNSFKVNNLFISSSQVVELIKTKVNVTNCYWVPEGINPELYKYYPYENKEIDVIALGRKYHDYHKIIKPFLHKKNRIYLYEKEKGKIIFPTRCDFINGLAKTKISICVPSSITHPDRSGNIETMTVRYLQSMVSKCLIVGHAPQEMITLFGYNPVIEIDLKNPEQQLQSILTNYSDYFPLIEKNYFKIIKEHTWTHRWNEIKRILDKSD